MSAPIQRPATADRLFVWVIHRFSDVFAQHAVLKGGMALRLYDCPRSTTDVDYAFTSPRSKRELSREIRRALADLQDAQVDVDVDSRLVRAVVRLDQAAIQIEAVLADEIRSVPMATASLANPAGETSRIVRVVPLDLALANKLAAWNERRLLRDLYDAYFLSARLGARIDFEALRQRLARVESRHPALRGVRSMRLVEFTNALKTAAERLSEREIEDELGALLPATEMTGLAPRIRSAAIRITEILAAEG